MTKILGLDLGTNSIGWALIDQDFINKQGTIIGLGSRIIPMDQGTLGDFEKGNSVSQTKDRTEARSMRRLRERHLLRRDRLHRALNILGFLPEHYSHNIDFEIHFGQFIKETETKLAYRFNSETGENEFIFKKSFYEMLDDFSKFQPEVIINKKKVPYDWTLYYLRKKALSVKIEKEELAWLILNFNQKRGYYQLRGEEEEENSNKVVEFKSLLVVDVIDSGDKKGTEERWYHVLLENGWIYKRPGKIIPEWKGKTKDFIVTTEYNEDGTVKIDKFGSEKRTFRAPNDDDWTLVKKKTEFEIEGSGKTVGCYIYDSLLLNPKQKIKGKLVRTVERKFYKEELKRILEKQKTFHKELQDKALYNLCVEDLYKHNITHRAELSGKDFIHLFLNDIIFFQRPLKSKKSLIGNCQYEIRYFKDKAGILSKEPVKCIARSNPLFQEFRLWQFIHNLRIYEREKYVNEKMITDADVTSDFLKSEEDWSELFAWLNDRKEIDQKAFLKYPPFKLKKDFVRYRWNYVEEKFYPANETRSQIQTNLMKVPDIPSDFLTREVETGLWHILYSVEDKQEIEKALATFAAKHGLGVQFVESFRKFPPFKKEYGSYSAKAIKKMLPLMRLGKYWHLEDIPQKTKTRIQSIVYRLDSIDYDQKRIGEIVDDDIPKQVIKSFIGCQHPLKGLNTYQACYAVYGRHSEEGEIIKWNSPADIDHFLRYTFKQHSLRNPIVEQVITEALRVVNDIWREYGKGLENFFSEIHIELGREMKNPADKRKRISEIVTENENTNLRLKALLAEMSFDPDFENIRPYSPNQLEILKLYEEGVLNSAIEIPAEIIKIARNSQPSKAELIRYKLWLEQKYRSPYTGETIPLSKLFTSAYEIEHIIPQSIYFDDSLSNKVICESEVNKDKGQYTAYSYIKDHSGKIIDLGFGKQVKILSMDAFEDYVKTQYSKNKGKLKRLLMDDIPDSFINRQMNDTRYISKLVKNLLSNILREENELEVTSKNVLASNGTITNVLKQDWGLNDVWNSIIYQRFERLNELKKTIQFGSWMNKSGSRSFQIQMPLELQKGFNKKRIDHRHHAMDALIIACASRNHINFLNNDFAKSEKRYDLRSTLCEKQKTDKYGNSRWIFVKPWETFTSDAKEKLQTTVVSFKQNLRVINKTTNWYQKWQEDEYGNLKKVRIKQVKGDHWSIRKPIHKDTIAGIVSLRFKKTVQLSVGIDNWKVLVDKSLKSCLKNLIEKEKYEKKMILKYFKEKKNLWGDKDISKVEIYYFENQMTATRYANDLNESFTSERVSSITDTGIQKILLKHLAKFSETLDEKTIEHPELAFSQDGLDDLNKNITVLNGGKFHHPIYKVRCYEPKGNKFNIGVTGNKKDKFVEAAKGTNLFFAIYQDKEGKRKYESIPFNIVMERQKQGLTSVPDINEQRDKLLFHLSPNDLVYIPNKDECENPNNIDFANLSRQQLDGIYKMVSSTGGACFFLRNDIASPIWNKTEFSALNKMERSIEGVMVKDVCWKLTVNRLGKVIEVRGINGFQTLTLTPLSALIE